MLVACILLLEEDQKWGVGSRRMGSTHVEEQNEREGRIKRVALRAAAKNGDPCFPQPVFLGSLLFSSELKDFLETAWVLWLEGPEVTDQTGGRLCSGQQSQVPVCGQLRPLQLWRQCPHR